MIFDACCTAALGIAYDRVKWREVSTLSGGEQKRLALEALLRGPDEVLLLDEPDNYLDVPGKRWLEEQLRPRQKSVLLVSHDRELLAQAATAIAALELRAAGNSVWMHGGGFATFGDGPGRPDRAGSTSCVVAGTRSTRSSSQLVLMYKIKAAYNDGMAGRYQAAQTRLAKFEEAGPPQAVPAASSRSRCGCRVAVPASGPSWSTDLELTGLMKPFDTEIWFGDRVAVLGSNGSGKSHFLRLLARGGSDPDIEHRPVE